MRLVEFLIYLLEAQAQTLQRLAALVGEEILVQMLEDAGEKRDDLAMAARDAGRAPPPLVSRSVDPSVFAPPVNSIGREGAAYGEIEGAVQALKLPEMLEFHLWTYPHYRAYIESEIDLDSRIKSDRAGDLTGVRLVDEAVAEAEAWLRTLPFPPGPLALRAERAAQVPWLRFRTEALKRIGHRPLGRVLT